MNAWLETPAAGPLPLDGNCSIGRLPDNDLVIDDKQVSRRHALIFSRDEGGHWLADFGSSNGVFLNRRRLLEPARLKDHDQIHIVRHLFVFRETRTTKRRAPARLLDEGRAQKTERAACPFAEVDHGAILLSCAGTIHFVSDNARRWVADYFQAEVQRAAQLPAKLRQWVRKQSRAGAAGGPLLVARGAARLAVRLAESRADQQLLLFTEERPAFSTESLMQLGLTPRESEVLHWVAEGKINSEIGTILGMSVRTVEKHLHSIFAQLDVQNRAAAMMRVMERFGRPGA